MKGLDNIQADEGQSNRGVSPVIGVILMVAITVILAAVIAVFVLGIGEGVSDPAPSASFDTSDFGPDENITDGDRLVVFTHQGGDSFEFDDVDISLELNDTAVEDGDIDEDDINEYVSLERTGSGDVTAGDRIFLEIDDDEGDFEDEIDDEEIQVNLVDAGEDATLNWESDGQSTTLRTHTISDAITVVVEDDEEE